ncbi:MAG: DUF3696 domain-containing protein [Clostridiales bacterium]|nr:DUF3696 domain-containing protein [Clostridiales bacterium]
MIQKIKADNFKCFEHISLELSGLNLLSGINSMGKSTLVQMLLLLRQSYDQNALEKGIYLNGKYTNLGIGRDVLYTDAKENLIRISIEDEQRQLYTEYDYNGAADFLKLTSSVQMDEVKDINLFGNGFHYIAADRLGPQSSYEKSYYEVWENKQVGNHGEYAVHYLHTHELEDVENERVLYDGEENIRLLKQVECWMGEITPGISLRMEEYGHSNRIGLTVHQEGNIGADYFTAQNVGFGISYVLPIVLSLLKAKSGELLILENPEAHLHPKGQRKMGELIARAAQGGVQIILETHSDHVLNGIRLCAKKGEINPDIVKLYYFTREKRRESGEDRIVPVVENPVLNKDGRLSFWPEGFFDEWDKAIDDLF